MTGWDKAYDMWKKETLEEARELFPAFRDAKIEVGEDGRVFINGFINTPPRKVTSWEESPHYMP